LDYIVQLTILCIVICFITTGRQIKDHMAHYTNPLFQNKIIMILLMAPIYAVLSSFAIWFHDHNAYILYVRDIYESILLYSFFELLRAYVGYDQDKKRIDERKIYRALGSKGVHHHSFPFNYILKPMNLQTEEDGKQLFLEIKRGILQYIPVKIVCAIIDILDVWAWFWVPGTPFVYYLCSAAVCISVTFALYYLVLFFHTLHEELAPYSPLMKFLTIKGVLFLTFWQEVILWFCQTPLKHSRFLPPGDREDAEVTISSVLVNFEMVVMSLLTAMAYSYRDFQTGKIKKGITVADIVTSTYQDTVTDLKGMTSNEKKKTH